VDTEKNLNAYGLNPKNGKNAYGFVDPTIRFTRYYFRCVLKEGKEPEEVIAALAKEYEISVDEMRLLAEKKMFIAINGYPKIRDEIQAYYEGKRKNLEKNYDMHTTLIKAGSALEQPPKVQGEGLEVNE
jgi:hypothetical protein